MAALLAREGLPHAQLGPGVAGARRHDADGVAVRAVHGALMRGHERHHGRCGCRPDGGDQFCL
jgi:hypothetical protein